MLSSAMPGGRRRRKILWVAGPGAAGLLLLLVALPLWFPWVLRPLARHYGAEFARYQRDGYSGFELFDLNYTNETVRLHADRVSAPLPTAWWWRASAAPQANPKSFLRVTGWEFESLPRPVAAPPAAAADLNEIASELANLKHWLPAAVFSNGVVRVPGQKFLLPLVSWENGKLQGQILPPEPAPPVSVQASLGGLPYEARVDLAHLNLSATLSATTNEVGWEIRGTAWWLSNRVDLAAHMGSRAGLPDHATLLATNFSLPSEVLGLQNYGNLSGTVAAAWDRGRFSLTLRADLKPGAGQTNLPPLQLALQAGGDTNAVSLETARLSSPWLTAELSRQVEIYFSGPVLRQPAALNVVADLSRQNWAPVTGRLRGEAQLMPGIGNLPAAQFQLAGERVGTASLMARSISVAGGFEWPNLQFSMAQAIFSDGSTGRLSGQLDLARNLVNRGRVEFNGPLLRQWLPTGYSCRSVALAADFHGPFAQLSHTGRVSVLDFTRPNLKPLQVEAQWSGEQTNLETFALKARAGSASLTAQGAAVLSLSNPELRLTSLSWLTNGATALALQSPCRVNFTAPANGRGFQVKVGALDLRGPAGRLGARGEIQWPGQGELTVSAERVSSRLVAEFIGSNLPAIEIQRLSAAAAWSNSPARFNVDLLAAGTLPLERGKPGAGELGVSARVQTFGDEHGLIVSNLTISSATSAVVVAHGFLPMTIHPGSPERLLDVDTRTPLQFSAAAEPRSALWETLTEWAGLSLRGPELKLDLSGTWAKLEGELQAGAEEVQLRKPSRPMPAVQNLRITVQFDREQARLTQGRFLVQGQEVRFNGRMPLGDAFWESLRRHERPAWDQAGAHLVIEGAELAAFEPLFPTLLAPQGELSADVTLAPGGKLSGELVLERARTRPLGNFGPIRNINVHMKFTDRELTLENVSAQISGAPLEIAGHADLRGGDWLQGTVPPFELTVRGTAVPLAREPDSIIRSDLNLVVVKTNGAPPLVTGAAHLRDSYYLADLRLLVPGKVASPGLRPPYFSIEEPALADWRLILSVDGVRFLGVRSPVFNGEVSTNLKLQGTLKDPIALGDVKIDSGVVVFPFANLQVQQGLVTLSSRDPYRPQLEVNAASRQFGYDIRMTVSGGVDSPLIQFNSTPPLSSEQILLMVTAGQMPQGTFTLTPQQRAQTVAMFLGRDLLSKLGFGDQAQQRLTIHSGEEISEQGRPTYHVEYKLTDRWSLVGDYDRFGDFNAGVKWRIYSK